MSGRNPLDYETPKPRQPGATPRWVWLAVLSAAGLVTAVKFVLVLIDLIRAVRMDLAR